MSEKKQPQQSLIAVTGASGHLGRLVIENLLAAGRPAERIVAVVRDAAKVADLSERGVKVRAADYSQPATLDAAFKNVARLLLVSSNEVGGRVPQHRNAVAAARRAGIEFLAYTSILKADSSQMQLAADHKATEAIIRDSAIPFAFLRNGWYLENYTDQMPQILQHKAVFGSAGDGRVSAASRDDYAAAAATVLTGDAHENQTYELGGDNSFTLAELAAEISKQTNGGIAYRDLPVEDYVKALIGANLPEPLAKILADADLGLKRGDLFADGNDLRRLINRPTTTLTAAVAAAVSRTTKTKQAAGEQK